MILNDLCNEDEVILHYTTSEDCYVLRDFIAPSDKDIRYLDIGGCLEETLHRLIDAKANDEDILFIMGAKKGDAHNDLDTYIDLNYVIPGELLNIFNSMKEVVA